MISNEPRDVPTVILQHEGRWWSFAGFERAIVARQADEVAAAVGEVERAVEGGGLLAAGYLAYEAAAAYGLSVHPPEPDGPPLLWFGLFRGREPVEPPPPGGDYHFGEWRPALDFPSYATALDRIKAAIARGDTYQANFTFPLRADFAGDPRALFAALSAAQRADYGAYLDLGRFVICSASPELFFRRDGARIESRPMKGTAHRGLTTAGDRAQIDWLRHSEKNRAENVMIVDMIRNDLGRVARVGSVAVPELFAVERYPTLLQMTSTVTALTDAPLREVLAAAFPCASITGAPKKRTMELLRELEVGPRGVYTGAIGVVLPGRRAQFNVAIRTAIIDRQRGTAVYHVGSGVVWDSDAAAEFEECRLKARVLSAPPLPPFQLLESLLWTPGEGYALREAHLRRLADSGEYFGYSVDLAAVERQLDALAAGLTAPSKVRLLVGPSGEIEIEARPLAEGALPEPLRLGLAREAVSSADVWLYHKTTRREAYSAARASRPDCDEVILWNERGQLTEATTSNLVLDVDGGRYTPPVSAGLLAGTLRARLLDAGEIAERTLTAGDLARAERIWLINSVRGWRVAQIEEI
jgi:para-aminobenzoate synthetase/4-amino-4-deoxychorismate lyase